MTFEVEGLYDRYRELEARVEVLEERLSRLIEALSIHYIHVASAMKAGDDCCTRIER